VHEPEEGGMVTMDGQVSCLLRRGQRVTIQKADQSTLLLRILRQNFYHLLHEKLIEWGGNQPGKEGM